MTVTIAESLKHVRRAATDADIVHRFTYHAPKNGQQAQYEAIRFKAREFAKQLNDDLPESREKSLALTHLEEVVMWANSAIARNA